MEISILSRFVDCADRHADRPAAVFAGRSYTYGDLSGLSAAIATTLWQHNVRRGDRVGIFAESSVQTYASILAILSCGAAYVPLRTDNPVARNLDILSDAGIRLVLHTDAEAAASALAAGTGCEAVQTRNIAPIADRLNTIRHRPTDLCYLLFTSGSTGKPKGVPIYATSLSAFLDMILESGRYAFTPQDRFLQMFDLAFDPSIFAFLVPLSVGASFYPLPRKSITYLEVADVLETQQISVAMMVPSVINYLKPYFGELELPHVRYSLFCGEALRHDTLSAWAACVPHAKIENLYGPTEATIVCLRYEWQRGEPPHPQGKGIVPIGTPMEGVQAFIHADDSAADTGELCLIGDLVTTSYWNDPSKTAAAFGTNEAGQRFYRTGDLCRRDQAGNVLYLGRIDSQVKVDGHRIELEDIEFHARAIDNGDREVAAVVHSSEPGRHVIVLFVEGEDVDAPRLCDHLRTRLPGYMIPREIVPVGRFPLNSNGKIDRAALVTRYAAGGAMAAV